MKPDGTRACRCKYCDPTRKQRDIDREYQLPGHKDSGHKGSGSGRHGASSSAATSETIIMRAKDYRNLKKPSAGCASRSCYPSFSKITSLPTHAPEPRKQPSLSTQPRYNYRLLEVEYSGLYLKNVDCSKILHVLESLRLAMGDMVTGGRTCALCRGDAVLCRRCTIRARDGTKSPCNGKLITPPAGCTIGTSSQVHMIDTMALDNTPFPNRGGRCGFRL